MIKAQEMAMPTSCLNKAQSDEPVFVLRAKDPLAADIVRVWAMMAHRSPHEMWKIKEARELANQMDIWRATNNNNVADSQQQNAQKAPEDLGIERLTAYLRDAVSALESMPGTAEEWHKYTRWAEGLRQQTVDRIKRELNI